MIRLEIGSIIKTNYNTGPYEIIGIIRNCTCPEYIRSLSGDRSPSAPHIHLTCKKPGEYGKSYLNGYNEDTLKSVWNDDYLIVCKSNKSVQTTLF